MHFVLAVFVLVVFVLAVLVLPVFVLAGTTPGHRGTVGHNGAQHWATEFHGRKFVY